MFQRREGGSSMALSFPFFSFLRDPELLLALLVRVGDH